MKIKNYKNSLKRRTIDYIYDTCSMDNCDGSYYAKALCRFHYNRVLKGISLDRPYKTQVPNTNEKLPCIFAGCLNKRAGQKEYCDSHQKQFLRIGRHEPLKHRKHYEIKSEGRTCTQCNTFKTWEHYYKRVGGKSYQANCKECAKKWSSSHATKTSA